jgi:hypothetical protein
MHRAHLAHRSFIVETPERIKAVECDAADANQILASGPNKTQSTWFGIALLVIGGGMTLVWIGFILWVLGNIIVYL